MTAFIILYASVIGVPIAATYLAEWADAWVESQS